MFDGEEIGTVAINDLKLNPGINSVFMSATIEQLPVLQAVSKRPYCEDGVVPFELKGKDVVNKGERLAYFADALKQLKTSVDIGLKDAFEKGGLDIECPKDDD